MTVCFIKLSFPYTTVNIYNNAYGSGQPWTFRLHGTVIMIHRGHSHTYIASNATILLQNPLKHTNLEESQQIVVRPQCRGSYEDLLYELLLMPSLLPPWILREQMWRKISSCHHPKKVNSWWVRGKSFLCNNYLQGRPRPFLWSITSHFWQGNLNYTSSYTAYNA